ncbi:hypothetical protein V496_07884 [Pseudogymnoascus sp. VKM F-4515 (FW-2607)]|nr:hypothetical protein V496_07884 [Pseudogymnoascus sp. VKM F-4515 (FW-2607)]KFY98792.1 hypothetical protein V498_01220 [Pseudogymnoascus sp. VKM F-4517 (FW-2822)]
MIIHKVAVIQLHPKRTTTDVPTTLSVKLHLKELFWQSYQSKFLSTFNNTFIKIFRYHLTGWTPENPSFAFCASNYKTYLESYCTLAAELQINIVPGSIVEAHPSPSCSASCSSCPATDSTRSQFVNIAYFISATGKILGSYQKANLWSGERAHLSSVRPTNSHHQVISTPLGTVGLLLCWDLAIPEAFRSLVAQGAKIIILPALWTGLGSAPAGLKRNPGFEKQMLQSLLNARAFENSVAVVFTNAGDTENNKNLGQSQVVMPFSGSVETPLGSEEAVKIFDLDMDEIGDAEDYYKIREDMTANDWCYGRVGAHD